MNIIHFDTSTPKQTQAFPEREDLLTTRCLRCHHPLRKLESRRLGFGKTCLRKIDAENTRNGGKPKVVEA